MSKIITLEDLVIRDQANSVKSWILQACTDAINHKKITLGWDGESVSGEPLFAFINYGRWLVRCKVCGNPMYVSKETPIAYCVECGNGGHREAWPVEFPADLEQIEAALLERAVEIPAGKLVRNDVEHALAARPVLPGLARNWRPGISVEQLRADNVSAHEIKQRGAKR